METPPAGDEQLPEDEGEVAGDKFVVVRKVARGGMGDVVEVRDRGLRRSVAMKVMRDDVRESVRARERFRREADVLARLEHPNIVPIHALGEDHRGRPFYTMKMVRGTTLRKILDRLARGDVATVKKYPLRELLQVFIKICDAVAFAHSRGVIHRDLKPDNVMVGEFGEVLVMDWGLAKALDGEGEQIAEKTDFGPVDDAFAAGLTLQGSVMGTPHYMSPEQAAGDNAGVDERSDVFALGAMLYHVICLQPPVCGESAEEVLQKIRSGEIRPPATVRTVGPARAASAVTSDTPTPAAGVPASFPHLPGGKVPGSLSNVAMRALEIDVDRRYQSVGALQADIEAYLGGYATSAENVGFIGQLWLLAMRHRVVSGLLVLTLLLTTGFVIRLIQSERRALVEAANARTAGELASAEAEKARAAEAVAEQEREMTRRSLVVAEEERAAAQRSLAAAQIALADSAYLNRDGAALKRYLEACPEKWRDSTWRYLKQIVDVPEIHLPEMEEKIFQSAVAIPGSEDRFALIDTEGGLWEVRGNEGDISFKWDTGFRGRTTLAVSGGGDRVVVGDGRSGRVRVFAYSKGRLLRERSLSGDGIVKAACDAAGERYYVCSSKRQIACFSATDNHLIWTRRQLPCQDMFVDDLGRWLVLALRMHGGTGYEMVVLDANDGKTLHRLALPELQRAGSVAFQSNGDLIAVANSAGGNLFVFNAVTGDLVRRVRLDDGNTDLLGISRSGLLTMAYRSEGPAALGSIRVFHLASGQEVAAQFGVTGEISRVTMHSGSGHVLIPGAEGGATLRRLAVGGELHQFQGSSNNRVGGGFLEGGRVLVENKSGEIEVHDLTDSSQPVRAWAPVGSLLRAAYFAREGGRAVIIDRRTTQARLTWLQSGASGGIEETVVDSIHPVPRRVMMDLGDSGAFAIYFTAIWRDHLYAVDRSGNQGRAITGKLQNVTALRLVAGDTKAVVVTRRKDLTRQGLELWDLASTNRVRKIYLDYHVTDIRPNIGGTLIALVGASRELRIVDADSFETRHEFRAHDQRISTAAFHPNQSIIATGSADLTVKLWDYRTGRLLKQFLGFGLEVFHLAFSPDGKLLLASSMDKTTRVWSVEDLAVEP